MTSIELGESYRHARINCRPGRYFDGLATCDHLEFELLLTLRRTSRPVRLSRLRHRLWLDDQTNASENDVVLNGDHRCANVAISCVILYESEKEGKCLFLAARSREVAIHQSNYHVVPAGMFAPYSEHASLMEQFSLRRSLYREYLEELFGVQSVERPGAEVTDAEAFAHDEIRFLEELLGSGGAELHYTGVAVNLMNLRPEVGFLLVIHEPEWLSGARRGAGLRMSWEYESKAEKTMPGRPILQPIRLTEFLSAVEGSGPSRQYLRSSHLVPAAAGALHLALPILKSCARSE